MEPIRLGLAMCGSFCTFARVLSVLRELPAGRFTLIPIMSEASYTTDTRFGAAEHFRQELAQICGQEVLHTIAQVEPIGPKKLLDVLAVVPCTGNTLSKLANGIADTPVTLAVKAHLRNERPVVLGISTNDALAGNAASIGALLAKKHFYFLPFGQDSAFRKPRSIVADFSLLQETVESAARGEQLQPLLLGAKT